MAKSHPGGPETRGTGIRSGRAAFSEADGSWETVDQLIGRRIEAALNANAITFNDSFTRTEGAGTNGSDLIGLA